VLFGAIEGGGTKFVCAIGESASEIYESALFPTTDPQSTLTACVDFFVAAEKKFGRIDAFGWGCFGPLDLRIGSPTYGRMLATPKPLWSRADLLGPLRARFTVPIGIDTDVNGAALAEWRLGAGQGLGLMGYVTVGTGVGAGVAPHETNVRRLMHAEMGHLMVRRDPRDSFAGSCPFHGDCLEGLASGPAIRSRWGRELGELPMDHEAWSIVGGYLGQLAAAMALILSVERIVFGGGVMSNGLLLPHIRQATHASLNNYLEPLQQRDAFDSYIVTPTMGARAGIVGAMLLAELHAQPSARQRR
jgi:fructokinase